MDRLTDGKGKTVDFKNTIVIMTSNAGAQAIVEPKRLGFISDEDGKKDYERMKAGVMEEVRKIFKPEFLNRIDEIMGIAYSEEGRYSEDRFHSSEKTGKRCQEQMNITLRVAASVKDYLAESGFDSKYGARPLRRAIQTKIEDPLANEVMEGRIHQGDLISVQMKNKQVHFTVKKG